MRIRCLVYENSKIDFCFDYSDCDDIDISDISGSILCTSIFYYQISLYHNWLELCEIYDKTIRCKFIAKEYVKWIIRN